MKYRGIEYGHCKSGIVFRSFLPGAALRWSHWARFFTQEERDILQEPEPSEQQRFIVEAGIDRAYDDNPVYRGDIREIRDCEGRPTTKTPKATISGRSR